MDPALQAPAWTRAGFPRALARILLVLLGAVTTVLVSASGASAAPTAPVFTQEPPSGNAPAPVWAWTTSDASTVRYACTLIYAAATPEQTVDTVASCGTTYTAALAGRPTGLYRFEVVAYDGADAASPAAVSTMNFTGSAAPVITSSPPARGSATSVSWSFTFSAGNTPECTLSRAGMVVSTVANCPSPAAFTLSAGDGTYTFGVKTNNSATSASTYVLDTTGPALTLTGPAGPSTDPTPDFTLGGGETGATYACTLKAPGGATSNLPCAPGTVTPTLSGDGTWTVSAVGRDDLNNLGTPVSKTYVLDTTGPTVTLTGPTGPSNDLTPTFTLSGGEAGAAYTCTLTAPDASTTPVTCAPGAVTPTLTGQQGIWSLSAVAADGLANAGATVSWEYVLDTVGPVVTLTGPTGPSNDLTPTFTLGGGEAGARYTCSLMAPDGTTTTVPCAPGAVTPTLSGQQGTWTLSAFAEDGLTNPGATVSWEYVLDTVGPGAPGVSGPAGPSNDRAPSFSLTGDAAATWSCAVTGPVASTPTCGPGDLLLALPGADGLYTLTVTLTDAAGNASSTVVTYRLDTTAYTAPGVSGPAGPSNDRAPSFSLTGDAAATWSCAVTGPVASTPTCGPGDLLLALPGADGLYTLTVTLTDAAGNASSTVVTYRLDTTAYTAPGVSGPAGPSNDRAPSFSLTGDAAATWSCAVTGPVASTPTCGPGDLLLALPGADGLYTLTVTLTDAAGNASSTVVTYRLDTTAYTAPGVSGPAGPSNDRAPSFSLTGDAAATWSCAVTGPVASTPTCGPGDLLLALPGADGLYTLTVTLTDAAGNASSTVVTYRLDTTAYTAPGVSGPAGPSNDRAPSFSLTGDAAATWSCAVTGPVASTPTCGPGDLLLALPGADGLYTLTVTLTDAAGNTSSITHTFLLDTVAPAVGATGPAGPSNDRRPTFALTGETGSTFTCVLTGPDGSERAHLCTAGALTLDLPADGTWVLAVTATDAAGNTSSTSIAYLLDTTPPVAPGLTGAAGPSKDRTPVLGLAGEPGAEWTCTLAGPDGAARSVPCGAGALALDLGSAADGLWTVTVTTRDAAGNSSRSTTTYLLDTTAPVAPAVQGPAGPSSDRTPSFQIGGESGGTYTCTVTAPDGTSTTTTCASGTFTPPLGGQDGTWRLTVTQTDAAGSTSVPTTVSYVLDTTPPAAPSASSKPLVNGDRLPVLIGGDDDTRLSCTLTDPSGNVTSVACPRGPVVVDLNGGDGTYELRVVAVDAAGNTSETVARIVRDTQGPARPSVVAVGDAPGSWVVERESGSTLSCSLTGPDGDRRMLPCADGRPSIDVSLLAPGAWVLLVQATDAAGNSSEVSRTTFEVPAPAQPQEPRPQLVDEEPVAEGPTVGGAVAAEEETRTAADVVRDVVQAVLPGAPIRALSSAVADGASVRLLARLGSSAELKTRWRATLRVLQGAAAVGGIPLLLLILVISFLALQNRIDRNDPKLALAPVFSHQELPFRPLERFAT